MNVLLVRARCSCHVWIVSSLDRLGTCRRCGEQPRLIIGGGGLVNDDPLAVTECLHEGDCR